MAIIRDTNILILFVVPTSDCTRTISPKMIDDNDCLVMFSGTGPFTLFAPNNDAFDKLMPSVLGSLQNDPDSLKGESLNLNYMY